MRKQWSTLAQWFNQRALRERAVLLLCAVALMVALVYLLVLEPATKRRTSTQQQITQIGAEISELETMAAAIRARSQVDPDQTLRERHDQLVQQLAEQRRELHLGLSHLVPPAEMPALLGQILAQTDIELLRLEKLAPQLVGGDDQAAESSSRLYRHRLQMDLQGDYLSLLAYLRRLEQLPRLLVWEEIDVITREYPLTTIRLQLYTLGLTEDWLGG
ncbi:MAG: type II secretion system protein GspM [Pelovirga sp.]